MGLTKKLIHRRRPSGLNLIELMIVLGISGMLMAGSLAWFEARKQPAFMDQMHQIQSRIDQSQTNIISNELPAFTAAACDKIPRDPTCPIGSQEVIFATGISFDATPVNARKITFSNYSASTDPTTGKIVAVNTLNSGVAPVSKAPYHAEDVTLPPDMLYRGARMIGGAGCTNTDYSNKDKYYFNGVGSLLAGPITIAMRRNPNSYVYLQDSSNIASLSNLYSTWGGDTPSPGSQYNIPCAIMLSFGSTEMLPPTTTWTPQAVCTKPGLFGIPVSATSSNYSGWPFSWTWDYFVANCVNPGAESRFQAEIFFDFTNHTTKLVTH
ncbi:MAG: type II secretion system protein [bacterium]